MSSKRNNDKDKDNKWGEIKKNKIRRKLSKMIHPSIKNNVYTRSFFYKNIKFQGGLYSCKQRFFESKNREYQDLEVLESRQNLRFMYDLFLHNYI